MEKKQVYDSMIIRDQITQAAGNENSILQSVSPFLKIELHQCGRV